MISAPALPTQAVQADTASVAATLSSSSSPAVTTKSVPTVAAVTTDLVAPAEAVTPVSPVANPVVVTAPISIPGAASVSIPSKTTHRAQAKTSLVKAVRTAPRTIATKPAVAAGSHFKTAAPFLLPLPGPIAAFVPPDPSPWLQTLNIVLGPALGFKTLA
jgi:hypothetical protein